MLEQVAQGFISIFDWKTLPFLLLGVPIGLLIGILPGIGGLAGLAIMLPFVYGMEPGPALAFLLAFHSVCATGGSVTAVLLSIPGEEINAATVIDGYPMTKKGLAGRALGAALASSGLGGVLGGIVLVLCVFAVRPIVMAFGLPEYFFLVVLGLSLLSALGRGSMLKGLISGMLGIFLSFFGVHVLTGEPRFWFGSLKLLGGFGIVPVCMGVFAIPEVADLFLKQEAIAKVEAAQVHAGQVVEGIKDVFRHLRVFIQSSLIGTFIGIIPGVGAQVAIFVAYGVAKQTSREPETFGQGNVEGVIAPESANNAKEGGALLPTLAFGIPGSTSMALLLGAFLLVGLQPGPLFLRDHTNIAFMLAGTLIFANLMGAGILLIVARQLAALTFIRGRLLGPVVLSLVIVGAFCSEGSLWDVILVFIFGGLGYAMRAFDYNRAALLLGFILGKMAEQYFGLSLRTHGPFFFVRPISLGLLVAVLVVLFSGHLRGLARKSLGVERR